MVRRCGKALFVDTIDCDSMTYYLNYYDEYNVHGHLRYVIQFSLKNVDNFVYINWSLLFAKSQNTCKIFLVAMEILWEFSLSCYYHGQTTCIKWYLILSITVAKKFFSNTFADHCTHSCLLTHTMIIPRSENHPTYKYRLYQHIIDCCIIFMTVNLTWCFSFLYVSLFTVRPFE